MSVRIIITIFHHELSKKRKLIESGLLLARGKDDEQLVGSLAGRTLEEEAPAVNDQKLTVWVRRVLNRLITANGKPDWSCTAKILDKPENNAYALPGGYLFINGTLYTPLAKRR